MVFRRIAAGGEGCAAPTGLSAWHPVVPGLTPRPTMCRRVAAPGGNVYRRVSAGGEAVGRRFLSASSGTAILYRASLEFAHRRSYNSIVPVQTVVFRRSDAQLFIMLCIVPPPAYVHRRAAIPSVVPTLSGPVPVRYGQRLPISTWHNARVRPRKNITGTTVLGRVFNAARASVRASLIIWSPYFTITSPGCSPALRAGD
jgi:hypothetical protein